jgi:DNA-binding IclR family transcriptional regulator
MGAPKATGSSTKAANPYAAPALEKGLDILEVLCHSETGLTHKEIATRLGRSVSELYRMLNCLVRRNYVASYNDTYAITTKLFQLSQIHPPTQRLLTEAIPIMQELSRQVSFSCDLRVYNKGAQTVIASVHTPTGVGFATRVGSEIEVAPSASGRVLVAFQDPETIELRIRESLSDRSAAEIEAFRSDIRDVTAKGFASIQSNQYAGLYAIACPILDINQHAIAALTVPMLARIDGVRQATRSAVEDALRESAARLSRRIG